MTIELQLSQLPASHFFAFKVISHFDIWVRVHAGQTQDGIGGGFGRGRGSRGSNQDRGYYMPGRGPRGSTGPGIRERDLGVRAPSRGDANDYCQHFVDTAQRPQNFLRDVHLVSCHAGSCTKRTFVPTSYSWTQCNCIAKHNVCSCIVERDECA